MPKPLECNPTENRASILGHLKDDESGFFIPTPKTVIAWGSSIVVAAVFTHGFLDGVGFKFSNENVIAEGSEMNVQLEKIIPAPKLELVTVLYKVDGVFATQLYKEIGVGPLKTDIPIPGMLDRTEFRNGVPIMIDVQGKDLNTFKFIEREIDVVTGKPYVDAKVDLANLRFQASIQEGVAIAPTPSEETTDEEDQKRPLIVDSDNATATYIQNQLQNNSLVPQMLCELVGGSKESCDVLDILHVQEFIETRNAINNSDARIAAMESAKKCTGEFWDKIQPLLEKALTDYIASFYDMTPEEAARLVKIQYSSSKPDFTKDMLSDYLKDGTLTDFATKYSFDLKVSNELVTTCSADDVELELIEQAGTNVLEAMGEINADGKQVESNYADGGNLS